MVAVLVKVSVSGKLQGDWELVPGPFYFCQECPSKGTGVNERNNMLWGFSIISIQNL